MFNSGGSGLLEQFVWMRAILSLRVASRGTHLGVRCGFPPRARPHVHYAPHHGRSDRPRIDYRDDSCSRDAVGLPTATKRGAPMSLVTARVTIPSADLSFGQALHHEGTSRLELVPFVSTGGPLAQYFWVETSRPAEFEAKVRVEACVDDLTCLEEAAGRYLFHVVWNLRPDPFLRALRHEQLAVEKAVSSGGEWRFVLLCSTHDHFRAFQHALRAHEISSTVSGLWTTRAPLSDAQALTGKQRRALELAYLEGYFDIPPRTNLTELAERVDISRQSYTRRLSRGLHRILEHTLMSEL